MERRGFLGRALASAAAGLLFLSRSSDASPAADFSLERGGTPALLGDQPQLSPDEMSYRVYQAWRNGATANGVRAACAIRQEIPMCPMCGAALCAPDRKAMFDGKPRLVSCSGVRAISYYDDMVGPLMTLGPSRQATIPCGWSGPAYFSMPQDCA